jgi:hypothetical protein
MKKFFITLFSLIFISFVVFVAVINAQTIDINDQAKEIESLKLKTGQLIDHQEVAPVDFKTKKVGQNEIVYSYIGDEVENANNIIFKENDNYSNTEKLDDTHFRIYSAPIYFKDENNFIHKIEIGKTTPEIWQQASVQTLMDKITSILKIPYAIAGTSYGTNDNYLVTYRTTSWYDVRTATTADAMSTTIVAYNWYQTFESEPTIYYNFRTPIDFDLTLINSENILSGSINLYASADTDAGDLHSYGFYKGTQAFPTTLDDYNNYEDLQYTDIIDNEDIANSSFNSWTLNNDGIEYLKTGVSSFMFMDATFDVGSSTPPDYATVNFGRSFTNSLDYDILNHPYIELEVSGGGATTTPTIASGDDIGVIYYNATTTKIDDNTTVTSATYNIPFFLFKFVYMIMTICLLIIITFFLSFLKINKKL